MNDFDEHQTEFSGLYTVIKTKGDTRGYLERLYCTDNLNCWDKRPVAQVNVHLQRKRYC